MKTLPISVCIGSDDAILFAGIVSQGIDARLTGFTKSTFIRDGLRRVHLDFDMDEIEILLRRLSEIEDDENAEDWLRDIVDTVYGVEVY